MCGGVSVLAGGAVWRHFAQTRAVAHVDEIVYYSIMALLPGVLAGGLACLILAAPILIAREKAKKK